MTTFGWDMSHYDAPAIGSAVSEGIEFITHKAGGDKNDAELATWWDGVKGLRSRILTGAYWVVYPGDPAARADAFLARLDDQCAGWRDMPFFLFADCERWNSDEKTVPSVAEINAFCTRLKAKAPKLNPMGYLPEWVYNNKVRDLKFPLIASSYVGGNPSTFKGMYPGDSSERWHAYGGKTPTILQYTSSATIGGQPTCDANAFKGDLNALKKLVAPGFYLGGNMYPQTAVVGDYTFSIVKYGDNDADFDGYNGVHRAQALLNYVLGADLAEDGDYGDRTRAAVIELMGSGSGRTIGLAEWLKLCGLAKKPAKK